MRNGKKLRKPLRYSEGFKKSRVAEYESGEFSVLEISKLYKIAPWSIYTWIHKYSLYNEKGYKIVEEKSSSSHRLKELEAQVKELERALGQKQIKLDYYSTLLGEAREVYGIDIEKNFATPPLKK